MRALIIGGCGSIGFPLSKHLDSIGYQVDIMDINEEGCKLIHNTNMKFILGDCTVPSEYPYDKYDFIAYLAACKFLDPSNFHPMVFNRVNILGNDIALRYSRKHLNKGGTYLYMSTDKAASPASVLGLSKLYGEHIVCAEAFKHYNDCSYICLRLGNVAMSKGNVVEIWLDAILQSQPITVRNPETTTRFFMPINEVVENIMSLILLYPYNINSGVYVARNMKAIRIQDLVSSIKDICRNKDVLINTTELITGEKSHEELLSVGEINKVQEFKNFYHFDHCNNIISTVKVEANNSSKAKLLTVDNISSLIVNEDRYLKYERFFIME